MRKPFLMFLLCLIAASAVVCQSTNPEQDETAKLVNTLRSVNTQEYTYRHQNGRFGTLDEFVAFLKASNALSRSPINLEAAMPYSVALTISTDGKHYQVTVSQPSDMKDKTTWCRTAAFSDDRGVIYLGLALGCDANK